MKNTRAALRYAKAALNLSLEQKKEQGGSLHGQYLTEAIKGSDADHVAVSATKSMTGHLLGGAGAIESVFTILALHHRIAPPTINIENFDDEIKLDVVRDQPRALPEGSIAALNNSFGFGGHNVALVFRSV